MNLMAAISQLLAQFSSQHSAAAVGRIAGDPYPPFRIFLPHTLNQVNLHQRNESTKAQQSHQVQEFADQLLVEPGAV